MELTPKLRTWLETIGRPDPFGTEAYFRDKLVKELEDAPEPAKVTTEQAKEPSKS